MSSKCPHFTESYVLSIMATNWSICGYMMPNSNYKKKNNGGTGELVIANDELKPPGPVAGGNLMVAGPMVLRVVGAYRENDERTMDCHSRMW
jgi:hypothetical protein